MKAFCLALLALCISQTAPAQSVTSSPRNRSSLQTVEPNTFALEGLTPKPIVLKVQIEAPVYPTSKFQGALGSFAPGTPVTLLAMSDTAYRVRGRARHGDVAGWVRLTDVQSSDPNLYANLKKLYERTRQVDELIQHKQVALGMTSQEVQASMGKPSRKSSKITAAGKEERLEYSIYEQVPQTSTGVNSFGQIVQTVVYIRVEVGTLSLSFKDNIVSEIAEVKGNPLRGGGVMTVPPPVTGF
ncbi:hypothetical protein [Prosthecobacter vanneervenii]|uniref:SH3b domain-containing protein n=1 Tax=Prosthecobacter vanneervenii TaxID=48466 RepID=A0A7W7YB72_9BACT|nr:hypothetical protein [Prosthecobacter vanneervenii]MBB5032787.1 hypothetical protein [Prosthecobacter vanneervenii]